MKPVIYEFTNSFIDKFKLTNNISLRECIYGTENDAPEELVEMIKLHITKAHLYNLISVATEWQVTRDYFQEPVIIHWGGAFRPILWEKKQGRNGKSQHVLAKAIDAHIEDVRLNEVYAFMNKTFKSGGRAINKPENFIHKDTRPYYATWQY